MLRSPLRASVRDYRARTQRLLLFCVFWNVGGDGGLGAETLVVEVADGQFHAQGAGGEVEGVVGLGVNREPVIADFLAHCPEIGEEVLFARLIAPDLGDGSSLAADDRVVSL